MTTTDTQALLAGKLHEELCGSQPGCGWSVPASNHRKYYSAAAGRIIGRLEPEIGIANVLLAASVVLDEVL